MYLDGKRNTGYHIADADKVTLTRTLEMRVAGAWLSGRFSPTDDVWCSVRLKATGVVGILTDKTFTQTVSIRGNTNATIRVFGDEGHPTELDVKGRDIEGKTERYITCD